MTNSTQTKKAFQYFFGGIVPHPNAHAAQPGYPLQVPDSLKPAHLLSGAFHSYPLPMVSYNLQ